MIQDAKHAFNPSRKANDTSNLATLSNKVRALEQEAKTNKWANKIVASFAVDDYRGELPSSFLERFKLRKVNLSVTQN